jgi:hypothetical protein
MRQTTYEFEQIETVMPNGRKLYCSGVFNISYQICPAEPDVGIRHAYPEIEVTDDWVTLTAFDNDTPGQEDIQIRLPWLPFLPPGPADPLGQIYAAIEDWISEKIMEIEDNDFDE